MDMNLTHSGVERDTECMRQFFSQKLRVSNKKSKVIDDLTFEGVVKHWKEKGFRNIITLAGAGISTSAGIPDFRSPNTGLYNSAEQYNFPDASKIFNMPYFRSNPVPFFKLAKHRYLGTYNPTPAHYFVRLLAEKGLLVRHYTQNIDSLERIAEIPDEKLVEAHGTFHSNHCMNCRKAYTTEWMKAQLRSDSIPFCSVCYDVVKPDIVFFSGDSLPERFYKLSAKDFDSCDLLIIMGTSLVVQPFASLINKVGPNCIRLLINRDAVGTERLMRTLQPGLMYDKPENTRDVAYFGNCDDGVYALVDALGWGSQLRELIESEHAQLNSELSWEIIP